MEWKWAPSAAPAIRTASSSTRFQCLQAFLCFHLCNSDVQGRYSSISSGKNGVAGRVRL